MSEIKKKIAKLLALSSSPNEKEAQEALLKARELMAKHELSPEECQQGSSAKVVMRTVGVECTKMTDPWAVQLGAVIGKRYCCFESGFIRIIGTPYYNATDYQFIRFDGPICRGSGIIRVFIRSITEMTTYKQGGHPLWVPSLLCCMVS